MSIDFLDPPAPTMSERELTRRRAHLFREIERTPAVSAAGASHRSGPLARFRRDVRFGPIGRKATLAVVLVVVIVALGAVLPGRLGRTQMTLVDQAIAAIGSGPMIHVVLDEGRNTQLVNLQTGKTRLLRSRVEVFSDPKLGTLWISTLGGKPTTRLLSPASERTPSFAWWRPYVSGYRAELRSGAFHVVGAGQIAGQPVDWIAGKPVTIGGGASSSGLREAVTEIAISRSTFKPLYFRQRIDGVVKRGAGVRVITAETLPRRSSVFAHKTVSRGPSITAFPGGGTGIPTTLPAARAAMNPDPVVPPKRIAGLQRTWIGLPYYLAPPANSYRDQVGGVTLYYGRLDDTGHPIYQGRYISITEFAHRNVVVNFNGVSLFRENAAMISNHSATMKTHGLYVIIQAATKSAALAAARALAH